ncbi:MAG TPA: RecQ family ATP-dependent DNA helicase, partial [Planctomycetota bacterium]|nr:RecQ family ATP-dependent DNA helicase [Planctomycetota bacterium]
PKDPPPLDGPAAPEGVLPTDAAPPEALAVLKERFGFAEFREGQAEVVTATLAGRDVLCVMPTGAGKSVCYQVPALLGEGVTLVVSPLIALMKDQVDGLRRRGIAAAEVNSTVSPADQDAALDAAERGDVRLLYVAPERFKSERFRERMRGMRVARLAVDEAHCISQWGHDFRPDYRRLGAAVELLGRPPILALTATAPVEVQEDIVVQLGMREPARFVRGVVRANLRFEVVRARGRDEKDEVLVKLARRPGATLVYCASRKQVDRVRDVLKRRGLPALRYHAGLDEAERSGGQEAFLSGAAGLMVATNAFGMGVDRSDIRRVVHYEVPRTVEAYVQESGRGGRDGRPADAVLLWHPGDVRIQEWFLEAANPSRAVVTDVFRVLHEAGESRLEWTTDEIAARMRVEAPPPAVGAALAILDRAALVRRGRRDENLARVRLLPAAGDLFAQAPLPPGLGRLFLWLEDRFGREGSGALDLEAVSTSLDRSEDTLRRGLQRLHELGRVEYVPPFRGRATELRAGLLPEDVLDAVDFDALEEKRRREERKLEQMVTYAQTPGCRARHLLEAFGAADAPACGNCDACEVAVERRAKRPARPQEGKTLATILRAVAAHDGKFGFRRIAEHLTGSQAQGVQGRLARGPTYGALAGHKRMIVEGWIHDAHDEGYLRLVRRKMAGDRTVQLLGLSDRGRETLRATPAE